MNVPAAGDPPAAVAGGAAARIGAVIALCCGVVAAAGQIGSLSDRADAVNIALPALIAIGSVAAAIALAGRRRRWSRNLALAGLGLLVAGPVPLLLSDLPPRVPAQDCTGPALRLVQFNLWKDNPAPGAAARWIRAVDPDVILLQEALVGPPIAAMLPAYPFQQSCVGEARCSTMILSRLPPLASGGLAEGDPENRGGLSAAWMRIGIGGSSATLVSVHLGRPWPWTRYAPDRARLAAFVRSRDPEMTIVAGDLNLPGWTLQMQRLERALGLRRVTGMLPTWPAILAGRRTPYPLLGLDHLLIGRRWHPARIERGPFLGSDHYPVVTLLRYCASAGRRDDLSRAAPADPGRVQPASVTG